LLPAASYSIFGEYMTLIFQVQQGPHLVIASQYNMAAPSSISTIGATFGLKFLPAEMG
jgi:hypothetical protein